MIVREARDAYELLLQEDHAAFSGELAARLMDPPFPAAALVAAARVHDNGWREEDAAPRLDAQGAPARYRGFPARPYADVWRRGVDRALAVDDAVGVLVAMHGLTFLEPKDTPGSQEAAREIRAKIRGREADAEAGAEWVRFLDAVSLFVCEDWPGPFNMTVVGQPYEVRRLSASVATIEPWPFVVDEVTMTLPMRRVSRGPFTAETWPDAIRAAEKGSLRVVVRRG